MDELELLLSSQLVDEKRILGLVDEYQLLAHYLTFPPELRTPYLSPIRGEGRGSFSLFESTRGAGVCEFLWKDSGNGQVGNVFKLIQLLYSLPSKEEVFKLIDRDFHLDLYPGNTSEGLLIPKTYEKPPPKGPSQISVKTYAGFTREALDYWGDYGAEESLLKRYGVKQVQFFWTQLGQETPFTPKSLCFSYSIGDRYKIYQPHNPDFKFINNFADYMVEGWLQLPAGELDLLILTKSMKDVMTLRGMGYWAISPRSESTPILPTQLELIRKKGKRVVTFFDQDIGKEVNAGQLHVQKYAHMGWENIVIPEDLAWTGSKDISDNYKLHGRTHSLDLLNHLLNP